MGARILGNLLPVTLALLGVIVDNLPVSVMGYRVPGPLLALAPIYLWSLVRPDLMSPMWVFLIGLSEDLLSGSSIPGVWAASFVATYALIDRQRDAFAGLSGFAAVLGFATAATVACGTAYAIVSVYFLRVPPITPFLSELATTVLSYIVLAPALAFIHRRVVGPLRSDF